MSRPRHQIVILCILGIIAISTFAGTVWFMNQHEPALDPTLSEVIPTAQNDSKKIDFDTIEIADTYAERAQGLQNRESLCKNCAVLFIFDQESFELSFWMKNTYIPLDIIFIDRLGTIVTIHENTTPLQESPTYKSEGPAQFVLEINAGYSRELQLQVGDTLDMEYLTNQGIPLTTPDGI